MRILVQRVRSADVEVDGIRVGCIERGLLLFVGFGKRDHFAILPAAIKKVSEMRIFSDLEGKLNLSIREAAGSILVVSQFTLYANCSRGRRPDFTPAASPQLAESLYNEFAGLLKASGIPVQTGIFGADMQVNLLNDGPVTFLLEF